ncbi:MAG: protein translocase subunit SecD [Stackebrandtia sp.]
MARKRPGLARKRLRVAPYFISLAVITGLVWLSAFAGVGFNKDFVKGEAPFFSGSPVNAFPTPNLGLDLQGGMTMTIAAKLADGETPSAEDMEQARQIIDDRVNGTGVAEPEVYVEGDSNIIVNVAGKDYEAEDLRQIGAPAELRFREVLGQPTPDYSQYDFDEEAKEGEEGSDEEANPEEGEEEPAEEEPPADEEGKEDKKKDEEDEEAAEDEAAQEDPLAIDPEIAEKLGDDVVAEAEMLVMMIAQGQPFPQEQLPTMMKSLAPFGELSPDEVAALPPEFQLNVPTISCEQLNGRTPGSIAEVKDQVVACDRLDPAQVAEIKKAADAEGKEPQYPYQKYMLSESKVVGDDVSSANIQPDQANPGSWAVTVNFNAGGADKWRTLATETVGRSVAIVLDNQVISAPEIQQGAGNGDSVEITGQFSNDSARLLAEQLKFGSLPLSFETETIDEVSPTLGIEQMEAGLLAGMIGMALVLLYCFAYYRLLGIAVVFSFGIAAMVLYPAVAMLGKQIGFTLTLAGIAGFIVSIGMVADSFVLFFERLKDEIKDGRSPQSAVPRAWERARRTILAANMVSILAAVVLYVLSIGVVRGFAFTLGLSTVVNLAIVFLFTHPLVSLMSRSRFFMSPRISGLGNTRVRAAGSTSRLAGATTGKES